MADAELFEGHERGDWVPLRTLVWLRWVAVSGQTLALLTAGAIYGLRFDTGLAAVTVGASVLANLLFSFLYPPNRRLSEREAGLTMVFDILQLGLLLAITGGLHNPFALLLLAPVTIAASVLSLRSTVLVVLVAIGVVSSLAQWYMPLTIRGALPLELPHLFLFGFWLALLIGIVFLALYAWQVTTETMAMSEALVATQLALARAQKLTDLGGVVAAAAHELGTPLATITLVSAELAEELADRPDLYEDARLIRAQADRCRDILRSMGRVGKEDLQVRTAPLEAVLREAAEPHLDRGKAVHFAVDPGAQPVIARRAETVHGLRNLIQNAVDFATSTVEVEATWTATSVTVRIEDDGEGFPESLMGRIGDPFVGRRRVEEGPRRPGYDGMGLGLFIAKTLLERTGAKLAFANGGGPATVRGDAAGGAIVVVTWPRAALGEAPEGGLGQNRQIPA